MAVGVGPLRLLASLRNRRLTVCQLASNSQPSATMAAPKKTIRQEIEVNTAQLNCSVLLRVHVILSVCAVQ